MSNVIIMAGADKVDLPKWPALVVSGKNVTKQQAAEILIRTDSNLPDFNYAGNDSLHAEDLNGLFGIPPDDIKRDQAEREIYWNKCEALRERIGKVNLDYLVNNRIVSSWIGGPYGWCNWYGNIFSNNFNIGKWPSISEVADEWGLIAAAFPFLDLKAQLFEGETGEPGEPVVEFIVKDGWVTVQSPSVELAPPSFDLEGNLTHLLMPGGERGISLSSLEEKLRKVYGEIPQF